MLSANVAVAQLACCYAGVLNGKLRPLSEFLIAFYKAYPLGPCIYNYILSTHSPAETGENRERQEKLSPALAKIIYVLKFNN